MQAQQAQQPQNLQHRHQLCRMERWLLLLPKLRQRGLCCRGVFSCRSGATSFWRSSLHLLLQAPRGFLALLRDDRTCTRPPGGTSLSLPNACKQRGGLDHESLPTRRRPASSLRRRCQAGSASGAAARARDSAGSFPAAAVWQAGAGKPQVWRALARIGPATGPDRRAEKMTRSRPHLVEAWHLKSLAAPQSRSS